MAGGEKLFCNGVQLTRDDSILIGTWYSVNNVSEKESYVFRFQRTDEVIDTVLGELPEKPEMDPLPDPVNVGDDLFVSWKGLPADNFSIIISVSKSGFYAITTLDNINDTGSCTITNAQLTSLLNNAPLGDYDLKIEVIRKKNHPVNPAYQNGIGVTQTPIQKLLGIIRPNKQSFLYLNIYLPRLLNRGFLYPNVFNLAKI